MDELRWRVMETREPVEIWEDRLPVLLVTGSQAPKLSGPEIDSLRLYVQRGGTIFSCTEGDGQGFAQGIRALYATMFPQYPLTPCGPDHPLRTINHRLPPTPRLSEVSNGIRPLAIHCDDDLPLAWQRRQTQTEPVSFEIAGNVAMYVSDRGLRSFESYSPRLAAWPGEPDFHPRLTVTVARLAHAGNCDPEPQAWERFRRLMGRDLQVKVNVVGPVPIAKLAEARAKLAVLSGTGELKLTPAEGAELKQFLAAGGTLLVEAAGGNKAFADSAAEVLSRLCVMGTVGTLPGSCPLYHMPGAEVGQAYYTRTARNERQVRDRTPRLRGATIDGRLCVLFSDLDLSYGLLGGQAYGCVGYSPASAFAIMRNIVLYAGGAEAHTTTSPAKAGP